MAEATKIKGGNKRRVQVRKERKDAFSEAKKQVFLDHLAGCANVKRAAAAAGVTPETVNAHRRKDPVFAGACAEAMDSAYFTLEAMQLEEAAGGGHYVPGPDAASAPPPAPDKELSLRLLAMRHRPLGQRTGKSGHAPRTVSPTALNESILAKLEVLSRRLNLKRHEVRKLKTREEVLRQAQDERVGAKKGMVRAAAR